jgi:predicted nucleic acid-binding protein
MATTPNRYLLDTNVLLRYANSSQPLHPLVRNIVKQLWQDGHALYITSQNCIEFWNVTTRPANRNGFGFTPEDAAVILGLIEQAFPMLPDSSAVYSEWRQLVSAFGVSGVQVHDARLVAFMHVNQISHILTFNTKDFIRYNTSGITAIDPSQI